MKKIKRERMTNSKTRKRRSLMEEIEHTVGRDPHETVSVNVSMTRGLYLHGLLSVKNGDYASLSAYVSDLIRRDKHRDLPQERPPGFSPPP